MSKYNALWEYVRDSGEDSMTLSFDEIENVTKIPLDHSFLKYKSELLKYGYTVKKISMKEKTVLFSKKTSDIC